MEPRRYYEEQTATAARRMSESLKKLGDAFAAAVPVARRVCDALGTSMTLVHAQELLRRRALRSMAYQQFRQRRRS